MGLGALQCIESNADDRDPLVELGEVLARLLFSQSLGYLEV